MKRILIVGILAAATSLAVVPVGASPIPGHQTPPVDTTADNAVFGDGGPLDECLIAHWHGHAYCELEADAAQANVIQPRIQARAVPQEDGSFTTTIRAISIDLNTSEVLGKTTMDRYFPPGWTPPVYTHPADIAAHVILDLWPTPGHNLWSNHLVGSTVGPVARVGCLFTGEVVTANSQCALMGG